MSGTKPGKTVLVVGDPAGPARDIASLFAREGDRPLILAPGRASCDLLADLPAQCEGVDALIVVSSPVAAASSPEAWSRDLLLDEIERNTWPLVEYTQRLHAVFGRRPRYVVGVSSNPDPAAAAEALNEVFARYLSYHLFPAGVAVNMVRVAPEEPRPDGDTIARLVFALTSGLMDAVRGQTLILQAHPTTQQEEVS